MQNAEETVKRGSFS